MTNKNQKISDILLDNKVLKNELNELRGLV